MRRANHGERLACSGERSVYKLCQALQTELISAHNAIHSRVALARTTARSAIRHHAHAEALDHRRDERTDLSKEGTLARLAAIGTIEFPATALVRIPQHAGAVSAVDGCRRGAWRLWGSAKTYDLSLAYCIPSHLLVMCSSTIRYRVIT